MPFFLEVYWPTKLVVTLECGTPLSVRIFNILYFGSIRFDIIEILGGTWWTQCLQNASSR